MASACGFNASIDGVVNADSFSVQDQNPTATRKHGENVLIAISEQNDTTLRLVSLTLPAKSLLLNGLIELGEESSADSYVRVAEGEKTETTRSDGVKVINALSPKFTLGGKGLLEIVRDEEDVFGTFEVVLLDGGYLEGSFTLPVD